MINAKCIFANPYFYISGDTSVRKNDYEVYELRLNTDGSQIGAMQIVVNYNTDYLSPSSISVLGSRCSIWAPANSAPPGQNLTRVSPYYYNGKIIYSCGITGSGYEGSDGLVGKFTLKGVRESGNTSLTLSDAYFAFLGSSIAPGAMSDFDITMLEASAPATPAPTASPTAIPTPVIISETLFDDVNIVEVEPLSGVTRSSSTGTDADLEVVENDNTVPAAPADMTPRPKATPYRIPEMNLMQGGNGINANGISGYGSNGEVMAGQTLRDLLIPGKSSADKTVVMINFISTLAFLIVLAFVIFRMVSNSRRQKVKAKYIKEMISGEMAALESKMGLLKDKEEGRKKFESEFSNTVTELMEEFKDKKNNKEKKEKS